MSSKKRQLIDSGLSVKTNVCLFILFLSSCKSSDMFELSDGTYITLRKSERIVKRIIRQEFRKLSKTEKSDVLFMTIDTNQDDK